MYPVFSHMYTDNNNDNNNNKNNNINSNNNDIYIYIVCETASIFSSQQSKRYIFKPTNTEVPLACRSLSYEAIPCCFKLMEWAVWRCFEACCHCDLAFGVHVGTTNLPFHQHNSLSCRFQIFLFDHIKYTFLISNHQTQ